MPEVYITKLQEKLLLSWYLKGEVCSFCPYYGMDEPEYGDRRRDCPADKLMRELGFDPKDLLAKRVANGRSC